jgi:hypothetical protein
MMINFTTIMKIQARMLVACSWQAVDVTLLPFFGHRCHNDHRKQGLVRVAEAYRRASVALGARG